MERVWEGVEHRGGGVRGVGCVWGREREEGEEGEWVPWDEWVRRTVHVQGTGMCPLPRSPLAIRTSLSSPLPSRDSTHHPRPTEHLSTSPHAQTGRHQPFSLSSSPTPPHTQPTSTRSIRLEASGDYPPNLSISLSGGKEINRDLPSSGERTGASPALNRGSAHAGREMWGEGLPAHPRGGGVPHTSERRVQDGPERRTREGDSPVALRPCKRGHS